ncbi:hypothetical protein [Fibrella forsythiae]|uniref:Lipoprotein n=1 Tax=Fibrella forsythiae TaxID=2817061 RepID=A0ABS3JGT5_9BACT|nr:hypothetical protein [Fibrella forsythiae]MBO0949190.1 hypothetical protein [Fibrella forsythiae]
MKRIFSAILLLLAALSLTGCKTGDVQPPSQLLPNGDLEQDPARQWSLNFRDNLTSNPNKYRAEYSTEAAASGTHSLKLTCDTVRNDTTHCYFLQEITPGSLAVGTKLTLTAKIKTLNLTGKGLTMVLFGYKTSPTGSKVTFSAYTPVPANGTTNFTDYSVMLDQYPGGVDYIYVALFYEAKTTGTAYFDDIFLRTN